MNNLLLLQYNNYFNKIIKKEDTKEAYITASTNHEYINNINFQPNDGLTTTQIINWNLDWNPDYLVVLDESFNVATRWFVIDSQRTRNKQFQLSLKRDSVSDHYDKVISAPCYIEKGTIDNPDSPLLFNDEGMLFNQIKKSENRLELFNFAWIVGYYDKTHRTDMHGTIPSETVEADITVSSIATWEYYDYVTNPYKYLENYNIFVYYHSWAGVGVYSKFSSPYYYETQDNKNNNSTLRAKLIVSDRLSTFIKPHAADIKDAIMDDLSIDNDEKTNILNLRDKTIYDSSTGKYYKVNLIETPKEEVETQQDCNSSTNVNTYAELTSIIMPSGEIISYFTSSSSVNDSSFKFNYSYSTIQIYLSEIEAASTTWTLVNPNGERNTTDASYNMFCIPYPVFLDRAAQFSYMKTAAWKKYVNIDQKLPLKVAQSIAYQMGGTNGYLYDLQLLPYCPVSDLEMTHYLGYGGLIEFNDALYGSLPNVTFVLDSDNNPLLPIIDCDRSIFTKILSLSAPFQPELFIKDRGYGDVLNKKISNEVDLVRITSPNYSSSFEYSPSKNNGTNRIYVDCAYKPIQPYIHVYPEFNGLYGSNFGDARGMICSGDFSLPIVNSSYITYQIQNKNYELTFNRQIENLNFTNSLALQQQKINGITGTLSAGLTGAAGGGKVAGAAGAVAGAALGMTASAIGASVDYKILQATQQESLSYTKDMFNYNLRNIQAQPNTISKLGSFNPNNKIVPIIEYYTCSDEEVETLVDKLKYNGMTINKIGTISEYLSSSETRYIQGRIIRLDDLGEDAHLANDIFTEIAKGVYM